jgi:hypothetical protein
MPQSERLEVHGILDELEKKPLLRKQLMDLIIDELKQDSELRRSIEKMIKDTKHSKVI